MISVAQIKKVISFGKQWKGTLGMLGVIPTVVAGTFYVLSWLDAEYASAATTEIRFGTIQIEQVALDQKLDQLHKEQLIDRLERQIEDTGDKVYELKRRIQQDGANAREGDRRQLDQLERRLERYERDLNRLQ